MVNPAVPTKLPGIAQWLKELDSEINEEKLALAESTCDSSRLVMITQLRESDPSEYPAMPVVPLELTDGRTYQVDVSPLNSGCSLQQFAAPRLTTAGDVLILVASPFQRAFGRMVVAWGIIWLVIALIALKYHLLLLSLIGGGSGIVMISIGLFLLSAAKKVSFDRHLGRVRIMTGFTTRECPLKQVVAIQAIFGGWHEMDDQPRRVPSYQLNLVLDAPGAGRIALANIGSRETIAELASSIATFLDVPAVQHTEHGDSAR